MKQKLFAKILLVAGTISFVLACNVSKPWQGPPPPPPVEYRDPVKTGEAELMKWPELFRDTALQTIIRTILNNNKDLLTAVARIEQASAQAAIARAGIYPTLGYEGRASSSHAGKQAGKVVAGGNTAIYSGYAVLNWELDLWGKLRATKRSALADLQSTISATNNIRVSLIAEAASQYFLLRDLDNRLLISRQTYESRKAYTLVISERFEKGYIPELDKLMAIQQESDIGASIPQLERLIVQTENVLRLLMGLPPGRIIRGFFNPDQQLPLVPAGLPSPLLQRRPDIKAAEQSLQSQYERIGVARANRFPSLSLTGILGFASPQLSNLLSGAGFTTGSAGSLTGPIFNFGQLKNQVRIEEKKTAQLNLQYEQTVLTAFGDVDNSLTFLKTYTGEHEQRKIQVEAALKALTLSTARYDHGFTSFLEVLTQQDNLFDAQIQESAALAGKLNSIVMLYKSLGGGW